MSDINLNPSTKASNPLRQNNRGEQAVFLGWQQTRAGKVYPLYNVTAKGHPYYGSTVTEKTLRRLNLEVPEIPQSQTVFKSDLASTKGRVQSSAPQK